MEYQKVPGTAATKLGLLLLLDLDSVSKKIMQHDVIANIASQLCHHFLTSHSVPSECPRQDQLRWVISWWNNDLNCRAMKVSDWPYYRRFTTHPSKPLEERFQRPLIHHYVNGSQLTWVTLSTAIAACSDVTVPSHYRSKKCSPLVIWFQPRVTLFQRQECLWDNFSGLIFEKGSRSAWFSLQHILIDWLIDPVSANKNQPFRLKE